MNKQNDEIEIKKNLVKFLLNDDITPFKKLIPGILSLDSELFYNLFEGIERDNGYNIGNKNMVKKLVWKFNNFNMILESWYEDKKYYPYIKELWINYAPIEKLKKDLLNSQKLFEAQMQSLGINYKDWPSDIKSSFISIIKSTSNTLIFDEKIMRQLKNEFKEEMAIIEELILMHKYYIELNNEEENCDIAENAKILAINFAKNYVIGKGMSLFIPNSLKSGKLINAKNVLLNEFQFKDADELAKTLINYYDSDYYKKRPEWLEKGHLDDLIKKIQLNFKQKVKYFYDNNYVCAIHTILSFINVGYSIYKLTQTYKDREYINIYREELNDIIKLFESHKKSIGLLPDDFEEAKKIVDKYVVIFNEDQKRLHNLIMKIHNKIKEQDKGKNNAFGRLITSGLLVASSSIGAIATSGPTAIFYGVSSLANVFSAVVNAKEIALKIEIIEELNKVIEDALEENKKINDEIANLCNELKGKKTLGNPNYKFK